MSATTISQLFPILMIVGLFSPVAAITAAAILFDRHRRRVGPDRRVPTILYVVALLVCGAAGGLLGLLLGLRQACPAAGNLCGLWPAFVTGPISAALAMLLVAMSVSSIRPARA